LGLYDKIDQVFTQTLLLFKEVLGIVNKTDSNPIKFNNFFQNICNAILGIFFKQKSWAFRILKIRFFHCFIRCLTVDLYHTLWCWIRFATIISKKLKSKILTTALNF